MPAIVDKAGIAVDFMGLRLKCSGEIADSMDGWACHIELEEQPMRGYCEPLREEREILEHHHARLADLIESQAISPALTAQLEELLAKVEAQLASLVPQVGRRAA